jgi:hypothetical protein
MPDNNPFSPGRVVPAERFYGRKATITEICDRLQNKMSVSLVGEARIGKSSLLRYLEAHLPTLLSPPESCVPIYVSLDVQPNQSTFTKAVLEKLLLRAPQELRAASDLQALEHRMKENTAISLETTARVLERAAQTDLRIILLLDEFKDVLARPREFDGVFFGTLRNLYTNGAVTLVTATRQPVDEIAGLNAYFANGMSQYPLGLLEPKEAEALVSQPQDRPFHEDEVRMALEAGGGHALRLQWAGYYLYQWKGSSARTFRYWDTHVKLKEAVNREYDQAMGFSRSPSRQTSNGSGWLVKSNTHLKWLGEVIDAIKARLYAVAVIVMCCVAVVAVVLWAFDMLTYDQLQELLHRLIKSVSS